MTTMFTVAIALLLATWTISRFLRRERHTPDTYDQAIRIADQRIAAARQQYDHARRIGNVAGADQLEASIRELTKAKRDLETRRAELEQH